MRLTAAQAALRYLAAQEIEQGGHRIPFFGGVWAIFGHGNVGGLGQALAEVSDRLPTLRGHDEQAMAHAAIGFAKASRRRRAMAVTTSIGPGATNLVTAAATAHVNRLPLLLLPGDVFADRGPDPVLQQLEHPLGPDLSVNDCLRPVSRYFDRIMRPEQLLRTLPEAMRALTDPGATGPVTLAFPQDVQAERADFPSTFFGHRLLRIPRPPVEEWALAEAAARLLRARRVLIIAGGGVRYAGAERTLMALSEARGWPVAVTQAGKGSIPCDHPHSVGGIGVTGTSSANTLLREADAVLAVGTRLTDFTTGSARLIPRSNLTLVALNVSPSDAEKHGAFPLVGDADDGLERLRALMDRLAHAGEAEDMSASPPKSAPDGRAGSSRASEPNTDRSAFRTAAEVASGGAAAPMVEAEGGWVLRVKALKAAWEREVDAALEPLGGGDDLPSDAEVLHALDGLADERTTVVAAAGGIPGDLHKLWRAPTSDAYLVEYGYSCMGHEIAGALGVKRALPEREVWALMGDGSYLMLSSELATSIALDHPILVVVLDNGGFGCIERLDAHLRGRGAGAAGNLRAAPEIDLESHARALGAHAETTSLPRLAATMARARGVLRGEGPGERRSAVVVIRTDPLRAPLLGGASWRVSSVCGGP